MNHIIMGAPFSGNEDRKNWQIKVRTFVKNPYLLHRIDTAIAEVAKGIDASAIMHHVFSGVLTDLKDISCKQKKLQEIFINMNTATVSNEEDDYSDIELF